VLPGWLGLPQASLHVSVWGIAKSVLVFLGIPLAAGYLTRTLGERARGRDWYESTVLPLIGPAALYGLLFTIVILFALQGHTITSQPLDVARIGVTSGQALAGVVGPLIEVPALVALVYVALWARRHYSRPGQEHLLGRRFARTTEENR